jgi:hypothetical protein
MLVRKICQEYISQKNHRKNEHTAVGFGLLLISKKLINMFFFYELQFDLKKSISSENDYYVQSPTLSDRKFIVLYLSLIVHRRPTCN